MEISNLLQDISTAEVDSYSLVPPSSTSEEKFNLENCVAANYTQLFYKLLSGNCVAASYTQLFFKLLSGNCVVASYKQLFYKLLTGHIQ